MAILFGRNTTGSSTQPEHLACIRVAIVGEGGVGKSTLAQFIAHESVGKPPKTTAGCDVVVKLVQHSGSDGGTAASHQQYFVELWDISGHKRCAQTQRHAIILAYKLMP
jgi:GTPase SAR1 family protein